MLTILITKRNVIIGVMQIKELRHRVDLQSVLGGRWISYRRSPLYDYVVTIPHSRASESSRWEVREISSPYQGH